jgi:cardiolipin synthase
VQEAKKSVDVQVFIFDTDDYAVKLADLLKKRSSEVKVRVLMDDMGSLFSAQAERAMPFPPGFEPPDNIRTYLRAGSHVQVRASANPWLTVDHRKVMIIDNREAFMGGMNLGRQYRYEWHDMMVDLTGPIVGRLEKDYRLAWAHAGPFGDFGYAWELLFGGVAPRKHQITNAIDLRPLHTGTGNVEIYRAQLFAIERAKSYIYIENPYFDDDTMLRALIRARQRGVDVRVILPAKNDSGIMQINNAVMANELIDSGVRIYAYPGMTHVKAAIYDGWACIGSANLNKMSLRIGQELDVAYSDPKAVEQLKQGLFETDFRRSKEIKTLESVSWLDSLIKVFSDQL